MEKPAMEKTPKALTLTKITKPLKELAASLMEELPV
jgi:hypothetical protein